MIHLLSSIIFCAFRFYLTIGEGIKETVGNALEDAYEYIDEKFREKVADGVVHSINMMIDLLSSGLSPHSTETAPDGSYLPATGGVFNLVKDLMLYNPETYDAGNPWNNILSISNEIIVPIATTFIAIIAVYDLYQMVVVGNGMNDFNSSIFARWIIKTQIALTLVANAFPITQWIFQFGSDIAFATVGGSNNWLSSITSSVDLDTGLKESLMKYDIGLLTITWFLSGITLIAVFLMFAVIVIGLMGRLIEMYMYTSIAPIPIATLLNNETKGIGDSWIRGALGLSFQVFFIIIALTLFGSFFQDTINSIAGGQHIVWDFIKLTAFSVTLIITILRSGQISKGMFGAH